MRASLESLRVFEACVRAGSFAGAAEKLYLSPAAVSLRIRSLERQLGTQLFVRAGRRVIPTPAARELAERVGRALNEIHRGIEGFSTAAPAIRVTAPPTFSARWLLPRMAEYQAHATRPAIDLDVSADVRAQDTFDVAFRTGTGGWTGFEPYPLFPVDLTPMISPRLMKRNPLGTPSDLGGLPLLPHPEWSHWLSKAGVTSHLQLSFTSTEYPTHDLNAHAAYADYGVALLPRSLFTDAITEGRLLAPFACTLRGPGWHFVLLPERARSAAREFCAWIVEEADLYPYHRETLGIDDASQSR